jgi:hypothetical protein
MEESTQVSVKYIFQETNMDNTFTPVRYCKRICRKLMGLQHFLAVSKY